MSVRRQYQNRQVSRNADGARSQPRGRLSDTQMDRRITAVSAIETLDSRGNPTVRVSIRLDCGVVSSASVPSGASTGTHEAVELRDGDTRRYGGKGVRKAVDNVNTVIARAIVGHDVERQVELDRLLVELDGTPDKSRLGANAMLGVSMAVARAAAEAAGMPLYSYLGGATARRLPMPMMNVLNGGKHADSGLAFQEFMIVPVGAPRFSEALRYGVETFRAIGAALRARGESNAVGDEGGFAPHLPGNEAACALIVEAIEAAGFVPGRDSALALDPAATSFQDEGAYLPDRAEGPRKNSDEMIEIYRDWILKYPIVSIEDGLAEDDWTGFSRMTSLLGDRIQIVGDDIYVTNTEFIRRGIVERCSNAALIKLNQIGTVTETIEAIDRCRRAGWRYVTSHRSGETEDTFLADFTVAMGGGQIKAGSLCRGERIAKYNRLLEIERELGAEALFDNPLD